MFASSPRDTLTTEHTALPRRRLRTSHNSIISLTLILRREEKASSLERKVVIHLEKPWLKYSNGIPTFQQPMKFQTTLFQTNSTSDLLMDLISQTHWEIKEHVVLATLYRSLRSLSQDSSNDMVKRFQFFRHSTSWCVTILTKAVMVDGHFSMASWQKMVISFPRSVHHTKPRRNKIHARTTNNASQLPRSSRAISLVEHMVSLPKRKWWKKFWETVS